MPMHFFSILQTLKLFLEIISAGSFFLRNILRENVLLAQKQKLCKTFWLLCTKKMTAWYHRAHIKIQFLTSLNKKHMSHLAIHPLKPHSPHEWDLQSSSVECDYRGRAGFRVCRWMWDEPPGPPSRQMWSCVNMYNTQSNACIPAFCMRAYLRSHTPFSCELPPSVTFLLSNTRASLKLTSQESSDSSPGEDKGAAMGGKLCNKHI